MPTNYRIYYPIHSLAFARHGVNYSTQPTGYIAAHGLQSVGQNTTFNLEQVFEIGQIEIYDNIENIPNIELTAQKVIDGYPLLQHLASQEATVSSLNGRYNSARANVIAAIYNETQNAASGTPLSLVFMSGMYLSAINFSFPVQGNCTESVTLVGNNRVWNTGTLPTGLYTTGSRFTNADAPTATGGTQRRQNVNMTLSRWPTDIPGISSSGTNNYVNGQYLAHIQNVNVACNLGRSELFELGRRGPYYRFANFPVEVTCSVEVTPTDAGDTVDAYEDTLNLTNETIKIVLDCGVTVDLGTKNKLSSVTQGGGDATGGNMTVTYNYSNFNSLTVTYTGFDFIS
jgi:hypothetical protein